MNLQTIRGTLTNDRADIMSRDLVCQEEEEEWFRIMVRLCRHWVFIYLTITQISNSPNLAMKYSKASLRLGD